MGRTATHPEISVEAPPRSGDNTISIGDTSDRGACMMHHVHSFCDGVSRRDLLRLGVAGLFGGSVGLPALLRASEHAKPAKDVSLVFLFLHGGLSTIDTWDLKPDAPAEFRGEFRPIPTNVTGIQVGEHLAPSARQMAQ